MDYFDGLRFLHWDHVPKYSAMIHRLFGDYYCLQFNYAGRFRFSMGQRRFRMYEGPHAWITFPAERCRYGSPKGETRDHRYVAFAGKRTGSYVKHGLLDVQDLSAPVAVTDPDRFADEMDRLIEALERHRTSTAVHLLEGLLLQLHFQPPAKRLHHLSPGIHALARAIVENPGRDWDMREEARKLCISVAHFRRVFHQMLQVAPGTFLQRSRLQKAAALLRDTSETISFIADEVGIRDVHYFNRLFCRQYQMPPARYRKHLAEITRPDEPDQGAQRNG